MIYNCKIHGDIDGNKAWGCPECVVKLRLRSMIDRYSELEERFRNMVDEKDQLIVQIMELEAELATLKRLNENRWKGGEE